LGQAPLRLTRLVAALRGAYHRRHDRLGDLARTAHRAFDQPLARLFVEAVGRGKPRFEVVIDLAFQRILDHTVNSRSCRSCGSACRAWSTLASSSVAVSTAGRS